MKRLTSAFALEVFERRNTKSDRLAAFMSLYVRGFGPEHRTSTNELLGFLAAPPPDRVIVYFGLTYNGDPCGFATFMHYPQGPLAIVDHLIISPTARGYGAFFSFCDLIAGYLEQQRLAFDHVVSEVMLSTQVASSVDPLVMMRLLRIVGFKVAKLKYWAPDPSIVTDPNGCRAALMLASQPERVDLPADELIRLVGIIYRVHYGGWYERTMSEDELTAYRAAAGRALHDVEEAARMERRVALNGMRNFDLQFALDPSPRVDLPTFAYILILAIPAAVGVATALVQERLVAVGAICAVTLLTAFAVSRPRFRRGLLRLFRL